MMIRQRFEAGRLNLWRIVHATDGCQRNSSGRRDHRQCVRERGDDAPFADGPQVRRHVPAGDQGHFMGCYCQVACGVGQVVSRSHQGDVSQRLV